MHFNTYFSCIIPTFHLYLQTHHSHYNMNITSFTRKISVFHGIIPPEEGYIVGYGAIIDFYQLAIPIPNVVSLISTKNRKYEKNGWMVFTPKHQPADTLYKQLVFALKYEGINLLFFKNEIKIGSGIGNLPTHLFH